MYKCTPELQLYTLVYRGFADILVILKTKFIEVMTNSRVYEFFYFDNAGYGEPDYGLAKTVLVFVS